MRRCGIAFIAVLLTTLVPAPAAHSVHGPAGTTGGIGAGALSADGTIVYIVTTTRLRPSDTDDVEDIYARTAATVHVSTGPSGGNGAFPVANMTVPRFGGSVFFTTEEALVPEDTDSGVVDVYQRDGNVTRLISTGPNGSAGPAGLGGVSEDGTRAFLLTEEALLAADTDAQLDVYERAGGTTTLVTPGTSQTLSLKSVSTDGDHVVFESSERVVPADQDNSSDVFENNAGTLRLVTQGPAGGNGNFAADFKQATPDGTHIYFITSEGLVAQDGDGTLDLFERAGGTTRLISTSTDDSVPVGNDLELNAVSEDGSRVVFSSRGRYTADDATNDRDVFEHSGGTTKLLSTAPGAICASTCDTRGAFATPDGRHVYIKTDERLLPTDGDACADLYERLGDSLRLIGPRQAGASCPKDEITFGGASEDGARVFFRTGARLVPQDTDNCTYDDGFGDPTTDSCGDVYEDQDGILSLLSSPGPGAAYQANFGTSTRNGVAVTFTLAEELPAPWPVREYGPHYGYVTRAPLPGHIRPAGATPLRVSLVPAARPCTAPNRNHGGPLAFGSCAPVQPSSPNLTLGVGDGSPALARSVGFVKLAVKIGPAGPPEDSDVAIRFRLTNVMRASDLSDYAGELSTRLGVRLTDRTGVSETTQDFRFTFTVPCTGTPSTTDGSICAATTSADAVVPGAVTEGWRAIWALNKVRVFDGGPDGDADTPAGNSLFAVQGLFVP